MNLLDWELGTRSLGAARRQPTFIDLSDAVAQYLRDGAGAASANANAVEAALDAWIAATKDNTRVQSTISRLRVQLGETNLKPGQINTNANATLQPIGYQIVPDPDIPLCAEELRVGEFTNDHISRLNEAFRMLNGAIIKARDAVIGVSGAGASHAEQLYADLFGAYTPQRKAKVLGNFNRLAALASTPGGFRVIDDRNDADPNFRDSYASCVRGDIAATVAPRPSTSRKQLHNAQANLTAPTVAAAMPGVRIWIGRGFFNRTGRITGGQSKEQISAALAERFESAADATIATMVHELAHATFNASDVPIVSFLRVGWGLDADGMPEIYEDGNPVPAANDFTADKELAREDADLAIKNADSYGQFALRISMN